MVYMNVYKMLYTYVCEVNEVSVSTSKAGVRGSSGGSPVPPVADYTAYIEKTTKGLDVLQRDHRRAEVVQYISFVVAASVEQENLKQLYYPVRVKTVPDETVFRYRYYSGSGKLSSEEFYVVWGGKFYRASAAVLRTVKREPLRVRVFPTDVDGKTVIAYEFRYHTGLKDWLKFRGAKWEPTQKFWYSDVEIELPDDVEVVRE